MRDGDALENNPRVTRSALEDLHGQVFGWALSRCDYDAAAAEDLVQQAYLEVLSGKALFDERSTLKTFVFAVVQNLARSRFRRRARHIRLTAERVAESAATDGIEEPAETSSLWQTVAALPSRQRDVVELVFLRDMTIEQASTVMGVTVGTGRVHYDRAKKALRERLAREHGPVEHAGGGQL